MSLLRRIPFHPFLLAIYPILSLLANNLGQVYFWMVLRPVLLSLLITLIMYLIFWWIYQERHKAALPVSLLLVWLFSYGHIYPMIEDAMIANLNIGRHRYLLALMLVLTVALLVWLVRRKRNTLFSTTQTLNIIALVLICIPLAQVAWHQVNQVAARKEASVSPGSQLQLNELSNIALPTDRPVPDVYYIILDAYGRQDTLLDYFNFDNSSFIKKLQDLGFFVASCSQSNYSYTDLSLGSSLNMTYREQLGLESAEPGAMAELIRHSTVRQAFESLGYRSIAFESGYSITEIEDADQYYGPNLHPGLANYLGGINAFEALLLRTSIGFLIYERFETLPDQIKTMLSTPYAEHRLRILYTFDQLEKIVPDQGPKFVFAHILAPHNPFVFGPDGELVVRSTPFTLNHDPETADPLDYAQGYTNQLTYINQRVDELVRAILADSATPPIIILQGDHGPMLSATSQQARVANLVAIYLPPASATRVHLYDQVSPVNIFRIILDGEFKANLGLLDDTSYFGSRGVDPSEFIIIPNQCP